MYVVLFLFRKDDFARMYLAKVIPFLAMVTGVLGLSGTGSVTACAEQAKNPFTVADEIGLAFFDNQGRAVRFSPDGNYFAVYTEHGRLDLDLCPIRAHGRVRMIGRCFFMTRG